MADWSKSDLPLVQEIIREAEQYIQSQVALAISADQRASSMASLLTAAGAAIVAGLFALVAADHDAGYRAIYVGGGIAAAIFFIAAALAISTAWPVDIKVPGNLPANWYDDLDGRRDLKTLLGEQAEIYQAMIERNNEILQSNARQLAWGSTSGALAVPLGALAWAIAEIWR